MSVAPSYQPDPREQLAKFMERMREAAPFGEVDWNAIMWDITGQLTRAGKRLHIATRDALWFSRLQVTDDEPRIPFSSFFENFAKAVICKRHLSGSQTVGAHRVSLRALRDLEAVMRPDGLGDVTRLEVRHFRDAESMASNREMESSAYRVGQRLEEIATIIDQNAITGIRVQYVCSIRKITVAAIATKMPSRSVLEALGDISGSQDIYDDKRDLILMRVIDILPATGFRIGEALTLPESPIVAMADGIGLRYWPEKGGETRIKQISSVHRELVERAVRDLTAACAEARRLALWCERRPGRAPLPDDLPEVVSTRDIEKTGLVANAVQWLKQNNVPTFVKGRTWMVCRGDLERALSAMRDDLPLLTSPSDETQSLGHSLIVAFKNELHADRATNRFVATSVTHGQIADFLGARDHCGSDGIGRGSIFKRCGIRGKDGRPFRITTHQFRHWLHTLAKRGGLSEVELARWMGRNRIADNRAYDHRTQEERVEEARALLRSGRAIGPLAEAYQSLPPVEGEAFLNAQVGSALNTPYGMCVHDYGQGPCERYFSCAGCGELLRRKGDVEERAALNAMLDRTRKSLDEAKAEELEGATGADNWVARHEQVVIDLITLLAVDDNEQIPDGEYAMCGPTSHRNRRIQMQRKRKAPKMSPQDIQNALHELDAWIRGERVGRLKWERIVEVVGFTRQALSEHNDIAERFGQAKTTNRPTGAVSKPPPKSADQRVLDLKREVEGLKAIINRYDERWARYARNAALRGIDLQVLDEPMDPPARANVRSRGSKADHNRRRSRTLY